MGREGERRECRGFFVFELREALSGVKSRQF